METSIDFSRHPEEVCTAAGSRYTRSRWYQGHRSGVGDVGARLETSYGTTSRGNYRDGRYAKEPASREVWCYPFSNS